MLAEDLEAALGAPLHEQREHAAQLGQWQVRARVAVPEPAVGVAGKGRRIRTIVIGEVDDDRAQQRGGHERTSSLRSHAARSRRSDAETSRQP